MFVNLYLNEVGVKWLPRWDFKDKMGYTALHYAILGNKAEMVKFIAGVKEFPNINEKKKPALEVACSAGASKEIFKRLLEHGGDVNVVNDRGLTPIYYCALNSSAKPELVKFLLDNGADPLFKNKKGKVARELAENDAIKKLLKEGETSKKYKLIREILRPTPETLKPYKKLGNKAMKAYMVDRCKTGLINEHCKRIREYFRYKA